MRSTWMIAATLALAFLAAQSIAMNEKADNYLENGKTAQRNGDYSKAVDQFTKAISLDPTNADAFFRRGLRTRSWAMLKRL